MDRFARLVHWLDPLKKILEDKLTSSSSVSDFDPEQDFSVRHSLVIRQSSFFIFVFSVFDIQVPQEVKAQE